MTEKLIPRNVLMKIKEALDNQTMGNEAIAQNHNVPVELVNDIADGRRFAWLFQGGSTL